MLRNLNKQELKYSGRLGLQQRVLPDYRGALFDKLAERCERGMSVYSGRGQRQEAILSTEDLKIARYYPAQNLHFLQVESPYYFLWQFNIIQWLSIWNPDVLIVEANPRYLSTRKAIAWMHTRGRPVIGWGLGAPRLNPANILSGAVSRLQSRIRRGLLRSLDALVAYSQRGAEEYLLEGVPAERVFVAQNAVLSRPDWPAPVRSDEFKGHPVVLFVGRIQARKRIDLLLRACAELPSNRQPRLFIVGEGPARVELETMARTVYPAAEFLGARHGKELEPIFRQADVFALPGTGGLAIQEAMAYALPVIVAEGDGTQDDLVSPENGWLVPGGDLQALKQALDQALSDVGRLRKMGEVSYQVVAEQANIDHMVEVFIQAINTVTR